MARTMKDSGIEWIGEIPEDWNYVPLKAYYEFEKGKNAALYTQEYIGENEGPYPVYSGQTQDEGVMGRVNSYDYDIKKCLFTTTVGAKVMTPKILTGRFCLSQNCLIMKQIQEVCDNFVYYLLFPLFDYCKSLIPTYMQPSLRIEDLKSYRFYLPSISEQQKIAKFLDEKCSHIDSVLEKTRSSIEEYKQLKQSVITQAVTKGIRPNRPMKDSGIEWIGEIPEDWGVATLKHYIKWKSEKGCPDETVLSLYRDYGVILKDSRDDNHNVTSLDTSGYKVVDIGDFVVNKMKAWQGSMAISNYRGIISPAYHICTVDNTNINLLYFHYLLRNKSYLPEYTKLSTGMRVGQWDLGFDDFKNIPFVIPPKDEQSEIVQYLECKCSEIDKLITKKEQLIKELETYKKSLIYEYVTGKKEV